MFIVRFPGKTRPTSSGTPADLLVIGLGNPGPDYAHTRHNAGQDAVEILAKRYGVDLKKAMGKAFWGHIRMDGKLLALGIPGTYMNLSGEGVAPLVRRYGIEDLSRLVVIHDELDLSTGRIQVKLGGGLAGHNGLKSIRHHLKSPDFARIRVGIDRPTDPRPVSDYVLSRPKGNERELLDQGIEHAADVVEVIIAEGLNQAMNRFN